MRSEFSPLERSIQAQVPDAHGSLHPIAKHGCAVADWVIRSASSRRFPGGTPHRRAAIPDDVIVDASLPVADLLAARARLAVMPDLRLHPRES